MVNYCCVRGCGRNSLMNENLNFHPAPKNPLRQRKWFELAGRLDVLDKPEYLRHRYKFCTRHFEISDLNNKKLKGNSCPSLYLPGSKDTNLPENQTDPNTGITCSNCKKYIDGYRYKCLVCDTYNICSSCESLELHPEHFVLRIPRSSNYKKIKFIITKWHEFHKGMESTSYSSSDDEPIQQYKSKDNVDLSEDVKESIRNSIDKSLCKLKQSNDSNFSTKEISGMSTDEFVPELAFADVDEISNIGSVQNIEIKTEEPDASNGPEFTNNPLPVMSN